MRRSQVVVCWTADHRYFEYVHIWGMSTTDAALTCHLIRPAVEDEVALLLKVGRTLRDRFGIAHPTVQIERGHGPHPCTLAPEHVV